MREQSRTTLWACSCFMVCVSGCAVDHSEPALPGNDAGVASGITIVIERVDASVELVIPANLPDDGDASTGDALAVISTVPAGCPPLTLSIVGPLQVFEGDMVAYEAHAMSSQETALEYAWSASNGDLSSTNGIRTDYTCTNSGAAAITLRAWEVGESDHCGTAMALALWCTPLPN